MINEAYPRVEDEPETKDWSIEKVIDYRKDKQKEVAIFDAGVTLDERLKKLLPEELHKESNSRAVEQWKEYVKRYLQETDYVPNNNQLAVSIAAVLLFRRHKRQFYVMPPG